MNIDYIDHHGGDILVVNAARVSFGKWKLDLDDGDKQLIHYLAKHGHWSPFAHPKATFRVTLPIFVARQWEKHRVGAVRSYDLYDHNEISRRYVDNEPTFFYPETWRGRPEKSIKQGSGAAIDNQDVATAAYTKAIDQTKASYIDLLKQGVAPEQARMVLPQSMYTQWIETGSLMYWSRVYKQRIDSHAQQEIQALVEQLHDHMELLFPLSWEVLLTVGENV